MNSRTKERVEQWDSRQFSGGYDGLADLAAVDFSGAVVAAGTWLFMLNGRVVGIVDGTLEAFETASGTTYEAPHPSLPLLCAMEEQGGDTRAKYYTNETPLREVDETLQSGSFTGYIELSENVLSGDYYAVYYGGRRMAAAYIGNAEQLLTGDEAFERADGEVGIYKVTDVDIDVTDVPDTGTADSDDSETAESDTSAAPDPTSTSVTADESATKPESDPEPSTDPTESALESIDIAETEPTTADETATSTPIADSSLDDPTTASTLEEPDGLSGITTTGDSEPEPASSGITDAEATADLESESERAIDTDQTALESEPSESVAGPVSTDESSDDTAPVEQESASVPDPISEPDTDADSDGESTEDSDHSSLDPATVEKAAAQLDQNDISWTEDDIESESEDDPSEDPARFEQEAQWRETRRIPSIDPDNTETADSTRDGMAASHHEPSSHPPQPSSDSTATETETTRAQSSRQRPQSAETNARQREQPARVDRSDTESGSNTASETAGTPSRSDHDQQIAALTQQLETRTEQHETLVAKLEELEAERDRLRAENDELTETVDRLRSRIEGLESDLKQAQEAAADTGESTTDTPETNTHLPPQQALGETNLFVRYGSKSQPTLETAHDGDADRSEVASNLRLEYHTGFDATDVAVDGTPYEEFLTATMEYRFVDWLTAMVLYEIRDTGNANALADLYDAIPQIDRAELDATISLADDDTDDVPDSVAFDIVAFDKMGNPLVVANLNDSREPATQGMLEEMEEAASAVKANYPDLAAATVVTSSYFEPGALEVAEQATSSGFLSRSSKLSYVNLSRKQGYHLCLVESRSEGFHMNVPEL
ncbi:DUF7527 domain-containing protein [Natronorubrum thiooxidans]|uniref:DUF7527 domain-containing protein n=1 Tax=Natronorubrum thiooxidans TaxID=308853 RepID=A0A1N7D7P9_9EURY|nr:transcriptional regulator [Natronorubrum thiooxidans]SIR71832.1 hypothetical protein SAMN05421752_10242 [Natronorubrum thiooxidans]